MKAKNKVIAGDYLNKKVDSMLGQPMIKVGFTSIILDKNSVLSYEVIEEERTKKATSAVGRALVGSLVVGQAGLLAGLSANTKGIHTIALELKDNKKSLIEVDDRLYKLILKKLF